MSFERKEGRQEGVKKRAEGKSVNAHDHESAEEDEEDEEFGKAKTFERITNYTHQLGFFVNG